MRQPVENKSFLNELNELKFFEVSRKKMLKVEKEKSFILRKICFRPKSLKMAR